MSFKIMTRHGTRWLLLASLCVNVALATYVSVNGSTRSGRRAARACRCE